MKLCIKITFSIGSRGDFLRAYLLKHANKLAVEGTARLIEDSKAMIIACGRKDNVDDFVDVIHEGSAKYKLDNIELEPFMKVKDYRGVFRVIE